MRGTSPHPGLVTALVLGILALGFVGLAVRDLTLALRFQSSGVTTTGVVTARLVQPGRLRNGTVLRTHQVGVRFTDAAGAPQRARAAVGEAFFLRLDDGEEIPVTYLPDAPATVELDPGRRQHSALVQGVLALVFGAAAALSLTLARRHRR